jgi:hypothetical protein
MQVTFITRADVHVADHPPEMRSDDWRTTIMGKLRQINDLAEQHGAAAILDAGDLFYLKSPFRNSHRLVAELIELHRNAPCPTLMVAGNHDIKHDNLATLGDQPINVLHQSGAATLIEPNMGMWVHGGLSMWRGAVPNDSPALPRTWITGVPYQRNLSVMDLDIAIPTNPKPHAVIAVVHFFAQKGGGDFFGTQTLAYEDLREVFPDVTAWVFGHWHQDQGVQWIDGVPFINVGAVSRGALREEDINRQPKVGKLMLTFADRPPSQEAKLLEVAAVEIPLKVKPADEVFRIEEKARVDQRMETIHKFAEDLRDKTTAIREGEEGDLKESFDKLTGGAPDEVVRLAQDYLRESGMAV